MALRALLILALLLQLAPAIGAATPGPRGPQTTPGPTACCSFCCCCAEGACACSVDAPPPGPPAPERPAPAPSTSPRELFPPGLAPAWTARCAPIAAPAHASPAPMARPRPLADRAQAALCVWRT